MNDRQKLVSAAASFIGCKEADGSHRQIIDIYNSHKPLARGYAVKYTDAWCATFVSAMAIKCGLTNIIPTECGCGQMIELFRKLGAWQENDAHVPQPGDFIFYDWDDSGKGDNAGGSDHVGIVEKVSDNAITVIEGNYSNAVKRRTLTVNGKYIRGYGVPKYKESVKPAAQTPAPFKVGDAVRLTSDATVYGKTARYRPWVYRSKLYVREVTGDRIVVSTVKVGAVTGPVHKKHLVRA